MLPAVGKSPVSREARMAEAWTISALNFFCMRSFSPARMKGRPFQIVQA